MESRGTMKKILFFIPTLMHGGAEKVLVNLVNNLDKGKYEITLQTIFDEGVNKQYLRESIRYKTIFPKVFKGNTTLFKFFSPKTLYKTLIKEKYDIAISYLEGPTARIISGCPYTDTKLISWIHTELNTPQIAKIGFRSLKECQKQYKQFDKTICVSETVKKKVADSINTINREKLQVLYNTNETEIIKQKSHEEVKNIKFQDDEIKICSVAKIISVKGYDRLVRVHKKLMEENRKHHIYLIGIGEQQKKLENYIEKNNLQNTFTFLGFQDNPYKYMAKCDLYVCSSRREGFSTAVTEALVLGLPVISTDCSGAKELLGENNEYGVVVENSEEGIYRGLKKLLDDPKLLNYYKEQAAIRGSRFSTEKTVKEVEAMFELLLKDKKQ